jgi:hypothetical protein
MVVIIFTQDGFEQMRLEALAEKAELWLNPSLISTLDLSDFETAGLTLHTLPEEIDPHREKSVISALTHVEKNTRDSNILIEYP